MDIELNEDVNRNIIKVIGVGGGGGNAANFMYSKGIYDVDFVVCNTDAKALQLSPIPTKITIGEKGLGAGNKPEVGRQAAIDSLAEIEAQLDEHVEMVFVTAGMGGGTGTGAAPVIAKAAKQKGILTVGIVTIPFAFEGKDRVRQALEGVAEMRKSVDAIIIITNERIKQLYGNLKISQAFAQADSVLATAAKGIAELITKTGFINVDMNDVRTVLTNSGDAIMGSALASGEGRALRAIEDALNSPLLCNSDIRSSNSVLLNISYGTEGDEADMDELSEITDYLQSQLKSDAQIIWGAYSCEELGDNIQVTIVVTGLHLSDTDLSESKKSETRAAAAKPVQTTNFLDRILGKSESATSKPVEQKTVNQAAREPEKLSDDQVNDLAKQFYNKDLFKNENKPASTASQQPAENNTAASSGNLAQQVAPETPVQQQPAQQQPAAQQPAQQPQMQQPQVQQQPVQQPQVQQPAQQEAPAAPQTRRISLNDLFNEQSLNEMERPNGPKEAGNGDVEMLNIP